MHGSGPRHGARDYNQTPLNIYWEMTQACALACRHCRAEAMPEPHPNELTTEEGLRFVDQIPGFGEPMPHLILTGGDPLARKDLYEVIDHAGRLGIGVSITPAATEALTRDVLVKLGDWPDYVFQEGYHLLSLGELKNYLRTNKHLPGIPSAAEVDAKGGVEVGDLQKRMLETIEQQALYILQLEERVKAMEQRLNALETSK